MDSHNTSSKIPIQFNGQAGEYFGIWIVNICLTLMTLGLYSPWAKVRQKRYFYGSTQLAGAAFDYLANPLAILKGRLIAVALLVGFSIVSEFAPWVKIVGSSVFLAALPWLIVRTRRFNAVNTVYRNLHFNFNADYRSAIGVFVGRPMLMPLTVGLAQPWVKYGQMKFIVNNSAYGNSAFHLDASLGDFFSIFKRFLLILVIGLSLFGATIFLLYPNAGQAAMGANQALNRIFAGTLPFLIFWIVLVSVYLDVLTSNLVYGKTTLGGIPLYCELRYWPLLYLYLTNLLLIVFSFGLLIPWAKVRMARYRLGCMGLRCTAEQLQGFAAGQDQTVGAFGEELSDIMDVDIGL